MSASSLQSHESLSTMKSSSQLTIEQQRQELIDQLDKDFTDPMRWYRLLEFEIKAKRSRGTLLKICNRAVERIPSDKYRDDVYLLRIHLYFAKLESFVSIQILILFIFF